jgi:hypothetical protein
MAETIESKLPGSVRRYWEILRKKRERQSDSPLERLASQLAEILACLTGWARPDVNWRLLEMALEALPLSTGDFGLARNHLANACAYTAANEIGAARFELRRLQAGLQAKELSR